LNAIGLAFYGVEGAWHLVIATLILREWPFFPNPSKGGMFAIIRGDESPRADNRRVRQEHSEPYSDDAWFY
jgi:hypothetical protein